MSTVRGTRPLSHSAPSAMLEALRAGLSRARALGRNVVVSRSERLGELPDPFELFHAAEESGERRFLMSGGTASQTLFGVGLAAELSFDAPQAGARVAEPPPGGPSWTISPPEPVSSIERISVSMMRGAAGSDGGLVRRITVGP